MGNEGAVLSGMKEAPEKFSDTIRKSFTLLIAFRSYYRRSNIETETDSQLGC
jgi:hypothetical protein